MGGENEAPRVCTHPLDYCALKLIRKRKVTFLFTVQWSGFHWIYLKLIIIKSIERMSVYK